MSEKHIIHGSCVEIGKTINPPSAVLIRGKSGTGKSDLALRLIGEGAKLVSDDQVEIEEKDGKIIANAPKEINGLMEVRGLGLVQFDPVKDATVRLIVDLVKSREEIERLPEREFEDIDGVGIAKLKLYPFDITATAKLRLALAGIAGTELVDTFRAEQEESK